MAQYLSFLAIVIALITIVICLVFLDKKLLGVDVLSSATAIVLSIIIIKITEPIVDKRVQFGKFENTLWEDLPDGYLHWLTQNHEQKHIRQRAQKLLDNKTLSDEDLAKLKQYGDDFEREVGLYYEIHGYDVEYRGLELGVLDGGIDLIATKENETLLIQCKYWKKDNSINSKMIKEFYGNCHFYLDKNPHNNVTCIYAIASVKALTFDAYEVLKDNYVKCRFQVI